MEVAVDLELGAVKVLRIMAANNVGRTINWTLVEDVMALMEESVPGRGENHHDNLIPRSAMCGPWNRS